MLMLFVFSCKTWNTVKPGSWLARPPPGSQQSQDFPPILSKVLWVLHSQQVVTPSHSQLGQCPGRLEARSEACSALSLKPKRDYSFNFPNTRLSSGTNRSLGSFDWRMALETKIWVLGELIDTEVGNMDATRDSHAKWSEKDKYHMTSFIWNLKYGTKKPIYEADSPA